MSDIEITDNSPLFKAALERAIENGLEAIGMTAETYAKKNDVPYENTVLFHISHLVRISFNELFY